MGMQSHRTRVAIGILTASVFAMLVLTAKSAVAGPEQRDGSKVAEAGAARKTTMKIRMTINGRVATATLDDTPVARDFASLLPLTLTLKDYASTEKVSELPRRLSQDGAPAGYKASVGDITYYAPWGNLAIFYRDFRYASGLIRLGRIDSGVDALNQAGPLKTTIGIEP